jgi:esterase/lipase superfamily enzyme
MRAAAGLVLAGLVAGCSSLASTGSLSTSTFSLGGQTTPPRVVPIYVADFAPGTGGEPTLSRLDISIPPGEAPGTISRPTVLPESPRRHMTIMARVPLDAPGFRTEVENRVAAVGPIAGDVLVFVHGFNAGGQDSQFRLARLVADSGFRGPAVLFSWPTQNRLFAYGADREAAAAARDSLEDLIRDLTKRPGVARVHVLAHSMGAWLAMEALRQNAIGGSPTFEGKLGEVMLAAPDVDLDVFRAQMTRLGRGVRVSIFVAADDRALQISSRLAGDRPRVGAIDPDKPDHQATLRRLGVRVYDLTAADGADTFRHGTFAEAPQVIAVIGAHIAEPRQLPNTTFGGEADTEPKAVEALPAAPQ